VDLRRRLEQQHCAEKGDVRVHFATLRTMREDLSSMGHSPTDDDFYAILLGSLPSGYEPFISALNATSSVLGTYLSSDDLMQTLSDEYDCRNIGKTSKREENGAFHTGESSRKGKTLLKCFNCQKKGHKMADCWAEGGGKAGQGPRGRGKGNGKDDRKGKEDRRRGKESAASTTEDVAWMATLDNSDDTNCELLTSSFGPCPSIDELLDELLDDDFDNVSVADPCPDLQQMLSNDEDELDGGAGSEVWEDWEDNGEIGLTEDPGTEETAFTTTFDLGMLSQDGLGSKLVDIELFDSGASRHMSGQRHRLINFTKIEPKSITAADKRSFSAVGQGDMLIDVPKGKGTTRIRLRDVLYAPSMGLTLVSIGKITDSGASVLFHGNICCIHNSTHVLLAEIPKDKGLYQTFTPHVESTGYVAKVADLLTIDELHRKLGHVGHDAARILVDKGLVKGVELDRESKPSPCASCEWGKGHRKAVQRVREDERATAVGEEIHSDLWGPAPVETINHKEYFVSFTDDNSRYTVIYFLTKKSDVFSSYLAFEAWLKNQYNVRIKKLRSDRGGEYLSREFTNHLQKKGTTRRLIVHDTPEYNGVSERLNRTLLEKVRAMLHESKLPRFLWGKALAHATFKKNRTWTRSLDNATPLELLTKEKPDLSNIHTWGSRVWVHDTSGSKLDGRVKEGRWVGFDNESKAHRIYWEEKRSVTMERSVKFAPEEVTWEVALLEGKFDETETFEEPEERLEEPNASKELLPTSPIQKSMQPIEPSEASQPAPPEEELEGGRGKRVRKESAYVRRIRDGENASAIPKGIQVAPEMAGGAWEAEEEDWAMASMMNQAESLEPTYEEVKRRPDWPKWQQAMEAELRNLEASKTWSIVDRPTNANVVSSKWVFRIKKNAAGEIEKYKARLVARGFTQVHGVDYDKTYAPVARLASFRLVLAMANQNGWPADSFDFDSAYLNSVLQDDEVIYLEQPPSISLDQSKGGGKGHGGSSRHVFQLHKALYRLKQSARSWYESLRKALEEIGFKRTETDHGVFVKRWADERMVVIAVHVDDCLTAGSSQQLLDKFKKTVNGKYSMTNLGPCRWLLGIRIERDLKSRTIALSQHAYVDSILARFNFNDLKASAIPMDPSAPLLKSQSPTTLAEIAKMKNVPYREAVGSLMYAAMGTRPDIAFATSTVAQFFENPGQAHWEAVKRIFRYLKGTRDLSLVYGGKREDLQGWVDADGASQEHRRAISGYVFMVDGGAISWSSKKQELVTLSTTEAEYVAATHAAKEGMWLRALFGEVFPPTCINKPTTIFGDNKSAIALAHTGQYHARTKHIDIRYHFIRYIVDAGSIKLIYCPTDEQTADTLTKALPSTKVKHFATAMGLREV